MKELSILRKYLDASLYTARIMMPRNDGLFYHLINLYA